MAYEMVIIKGLTENAIGRLATLSDTMEKRFERVDIRLNGMDAHLETMESRLSRVETRLDTIDARLEELTTIRATLAQILARLPEKP